MVDENKLAVLILAAGASSRMGKPKQLLPWKNTTLLGHAIIQARQVSTAVFVVLGANANAIKKSLKDDVTVLENLGWKKGMGTSIAFGINEILESYSFDAVLIMLADQPMLVASYMSDLKQSFFASECKIVATKYASRNGVPAIFDASLFNKLRTLNEDYGAQKLIKEYIGSLEAIDPEGKAIDIDTPEAYQQLKKQIR